MSVPKRRGSDMVELRHAAPRNPVKKVPLAYRKSASTGTDALAAGLTSVKAPPRTYAR